MRSFISGISSERVKLERVENFADYRLYSATPLSGVEMISVEFPRVDGLSEDPGWRSAPGTRV